ncbi:MULTISPECIES: helix-turn-helix transcriptional regulator [unclassified Rhodococcus (in: high G+C Gram-positive bacteria)]|uniref:helix-turn-helix transcriptional regulator n=1 Tax=unclassified Rhodococcus (in: high G+C Gram-positive bacteria) TaxID=192944 RepID=UPI0007000BE9|nr:MULTISPECIES: helix-turn-helix domain-containing protein [unclassified Rhodococcus (in: high G+C Gram-positive bacteria)]KQU30310.1 hypothetical protein ASG69_04430 [Rhodococcus sp. Leaf225]KQU44785.1 hypothetical protein ASH03_12710 [Rhodococcus sp. Leaf258]
MSESLLNIRQVADRTGLSPSRILTLRSNGAIAKYGQHPLFSLGFKVGTSSNARLQWRESDVDEFLAQCRDDAMRAAS